GIEALFPIQAQTYDSVYDGLDLIGKAKTGQGKTLAFILPILESLTNGPEKASRKTGYGRAPIILVLLPTRELAKQVYTDFEYYGKSVGLTACCLYGGASIGPQTTQLKRGVDIVVGAVGRIKDHIDRGNLDLKSLKFRILDEANEMLRQSFVEDVEYILSKVNDATKVQTVLFSATLPSWVNHIAAKFLKSDKKIVDLVGLKVMKASESVRHIIMPCSWNARSQVIPDIINHHSSGGRTIVFTKIQGILDYLNLLADRFNTLWKDLTPYKFNSLHFHI
ncbi:DEAD-box ATP-dependent RNA helicase 7, partial [Tanacetum coccineum]